MSNLDNTKFVDQAQLKQVMLANADKADQRYAKKTDITDFVKRNELGNLASKDLVTTEDLDSALAGIIDAKAEASEVYTSVETDEAIANAINGLGALASKDLVTTDDLGDALKNRIYDTYTKAEVYNTDQTYTKTEIDNAINNKVASVYKPAGSSAFEDLPTPSEDILGYVYDMTDEFTTDEKFVDEGKLVRAGTNVVVVEVSEGVYKYDTLATSIDLSNYVQFDDIVLASSEDIQDIIDSLYKGMDTNPDPAIVETVLSSTTSLGEITNFFKEEGVTTVKAKLAEDVTVPDRADGKISTISVKSGETLELDLNGKELNVDSYALMTAGGNVTPKNGTITTRRTANTYPALYANSGKITLENMVVDTTQPEIEEGQHNWLYGLVTANDGIFEIKDSYIKTGEAACLSVCNGTSAGAGAQFIVSGNSVLETTDSAAIYMADNKDVIIKDNAIIKGGIIARMGNIIVKDNAQIINEVVDPIDDFVTFLNASGTIQIADGILGMAGMYTTNTDSNEMNISIEGNAKVSTVNGDGIKICKMDTLYQQDVNVSIQNSTNVTVPEGFEKCTVLTHDQLAAMAEAAGKTIKAKTVDTSVVVTIDGEIVYNDTPTP